MKRLLLLLLAAVLLCLGGCALLNKETDSEDYTLWVVTEVSSIDGMNMQLETIAWRIEEAYPGLTVQIEILPTDEQERSIRLKRIRTQVMTGGGPDVYLLPTGSDIDEDGTRYKEVSYIVEPLFSDVARAMENGFFFRHFRVL